MRKIKAGKRGQTTKYISRAKAIRKLQLSLKDFRKMCILKGIYPREPPKKLKQKSRSYYHLKDINFLSLDPIIDKMRAQKVYLKRYKKAKAKGEVGKIQYLAKHKPKLSLNHLVRERYPDFLDALRDLDDPLSLMALFSIFPSHKQFNLTGDKIDTCTKLLKHFELYLIKTHSLKKAFVSIKGIYYQSQILGQKITYIVPYKYPPNLPIDVDYRVMSTFLDFYIVLLKFVNFKLYSTINLKYPPTEIDSTTYAGYQFQKINNNQLEDEKYQIDQQFQQKDKQNKTLLFSGLHFYLSTEVPRYSLQFLILSFGGTVELENNGVGITHVITDRDNITKQKMKEYVQPQWVYDSINFNKLLNVKQYDINKKLPPHISPFFDENDDNRYIPQREKQLRGLIQEPQKIHDTQIQHDQYDIIQENKAKAAIKHKQEKDFAQISKNIMSNKNRKLLRTMQKGIDKKAESKQKLLQKSSKLSKNTQ